jgi:hypothetical protein
MFHQRRGEILSVRPERGLVYHRMRPSRLMLPCAHSFAQRKSKVNLTRVPDRTADDIRILVESEVRKITDTSTVQAIQTFLITPVLR